MESLVNHNLNSEMPAIPIEILKASNFSHRFFYSHTVFMNTSVVDKDIHDLSSNWSCPESNVKSKSLLSYSSLIWPLFEGQAVCFMILD